MYVYAGEQHIESSRPRIRAARVPTLASCMWLSLVGPILRSRWSSPRSPGRVQRDARPSRGPRRAGARDGHGDFFVLEFSLGRRECRRHSDTRHVHTTRQSGRDSGVPRASKSFIRHLFFRTAALRHGGTGAKLCVIPISDPAHGIRTTYDYDSTRMSHPSRILYNSVLNHHHVILRRAPPRPSGP